MYSGQPFVIFQCSCDIVTCRLNWPRGWFAHAYVLHHRLNLSELLLDWNLSRIRELFGSFFGCFWQICRNSVLFRELFQRFGIIWKLFGAFLTNFEIAQNFLCYFLENSEFGRNPKFREKGTALISGATLSRLLLFSFKKNSICWLLEIWNIVKQFGWQFW